MNKIQQKRWLVDVALFAVFIACFFLDVTGMALHQWLGIIAGLVAAYHLVSHRSWVSAVTRRFVGNTSNQARLYYLIDVFILGGFSAMLGTGLIISTWLNLALAQYELWRNLHILVSISTLVMVVVKIGLHWRWILSVAGNIFSSPAARRGTASPVFSAKVNPAGRRQFLRMMGAVGGVSLVVAGKSFISLRTFASAANTQISNVPVTGTTSQISETVNSSTPTTAATEVSEATGVATATATVASQALQSTGASVTSSQTTSGSCVIRCGKRCSYPGHCRRYVDSNSNGLCDQGECLS